MVRLGVAVLVDRFVELEDVPDDVGPGELRVLLEGGKAVLLALRVQLPERVFALRRGRGLGHAEWLGARAGVCGPALGNNWSVPAAALTTVPEGAKWSRSQSLTVAQSVLILLSPAGVLTGNDMTTSIESSLPRKSLTLPGGETPVVIWTLPPSGVWRPSEAPFHSGLTPGRSGPLLLPTASAM